MCVYKFSEHFGSQNCLRLLTGEKLCRSFIGWVADSDSGSSSGSESEADDGQTAGAGPRASHEKV